MGHAEITAGGTHQPHWQQLAEPDSPKSFDLWYTQLRAFCDAWC
jgi:hypothetical protein